MESSKEENLIQWNWTQKIWLQILFFMESWLHLLSASGGIAVKFKKLALHPHKPTAFHFAAASFTLSEHIKEAPFRYWKVL